ncbi:L,D-transpeptidase family protein [Oricola cellulosilytica]|uniref:Murein L,D-transpeptidase n=1 Tax=Oricola cellulosilytica TaxID=1429082 RepID=A0A4R0P9B2_9HYPH|nr:murein L,D-transpeptidase [Oricola cellulosilytica]
MVLRRTLTALVLAGATALAGCQANDILALKENAPIPKDALAFMKANGMTSASPIFMRIFKNEGVLEMWKQKDTGRYDLVKSYEICKYSGVPGPKFKEGDRQAPEGFYFVSRSLLNPNSSYHLSFNMGFPNAYDRSLGRTGTNLMVHGACSSAGCYSMTDEYIAEIYAFAREALNGGQQDAFQIQAFPFRMTPENLAENRGSPHFEFWKMLKEGYDHFELTKVPPKVDICDRRYVFNQEAEDGEFVPTQQCPQTTMPERLAVAYNTLQSQHALAFEQAVAKLEGREIPEQLQSIPTTPVQDLLESPAYTGSTTSAE